jgi:hypothetical protein
MFLILQHSFKKIVNRKSRRYIYMKFISCGSATSQLSRLVYDLHPTFIFLSFLKRQFLDFDPNWQPRWNALPATAKNLTHFGYSFQKSHLLRIFHPELLLCDLGSETSELVSGASCSLIYREIQGQQPQNRDAVLHFYPWPLDLFSPGTNKSKKISR